MNPYRSREQPAGEEPKQAPIWFAVVGLWLNIALAPTMVRLIELLVKA